MSLFDVKSPLDVRCICSVMAKSGGELDLQNLSLEEIFALGTEPILFKIAEGDYYSFMPSEIERVIAMDEEYRLVDLQGEPRFTIVVPSDDVYYTMDLVMLNELVSNGVKFAIHTPSKVIASVPGVFYTHEVDDAWQFDSTRTTSTVPDGSLWIGNRPVDGIPHLATGLDEKLIYQRDEAYLEMLKGFSDKIFVLDELSKFLLADEGIESEVLL